ncbi:MAG: Peptidase, M23 family [Microgenomates group bacterium GW2011_GWF2_47_9]|nr:MAG: Peptidase, M23 family [Microgenomates group bacterium GW2011_GWF2_47_9]
MKKYKIRSHPLSKRVLPLLEHKRLVKGLGQVTLIALLVGAAVYPTRAFNYEAVPEGVIGATEIKVTTESAYAFPVSEPIGISQYYHQFHRGIDIRAAEGVPVLAVARGVVVEVKRTRAGYGEYVRLAHDGTVSSLYAHMSKIEVTLGQVVEKQEKIGEIGRTGWATGPHLHFEITEGISTVNPGPLIVSGR